jgi:hypothetical protein
MDIYAKQIRKLLEGPVQTVGYLGTRDEHCQVSVVFVLGFGVSTRPLSVTAYVPEATLGNTIRNLQISDYATLLIVDAGTFEGIQVKGPAVLRPGDAAGETFMEMNVQRMKEFYDMEFYKPISKSPLIAVDVTVKEIYNQTPGVGAGERLQLDGRDGS